MRLIKPSIEFLWMTQLPLITIEYAGRTCYKSEDKITLGSAKNFVEMLLKRGHEAMIEHASASYKVVCDRGVTHEIVRHRLFSYAQESTRYCNYEGGVTYIIPCWFPDNPNIKEKEYEEAPVPSAVGASISWWFSSMLNAEETYQTLVRNYEWSPQQARSVLPNSLKTEIVITGNLREWRHFFKLRTAATAHPQMQEVANMLLRDITKQVPVIFDSYVKHNS